MTCSMLPGLDAGGFDEKRKKLAPMWQAVCFRVALQLIWLRPNPEPEHPFGDIQLLDSGSSQKEQGQPENLTTGKMPHTRCTRSYLAFTFHVHQPERMHLCKMQYFYA